MGKVAELFKGMTAVVTLGMVVGWIIFWFGVLPLVATIFNMAFTGLEFLGIFALMIILIRLVAKLLFDI